MEAYHADQHIVKLEPTKQSPTMRYEHILDALQQDNAMASNNDDPEDSNDKEFEEAYEALVQPLLREIHDLQRGITRPLEIEKTEEGPHTTFKVTNPYEDDERWDD